MTPARRPLARALSALAIAGLTTAYLSMPASSAEPTVMTPIGGGYETETLQGFARTAMEGASGPTVDIVVVPSAYGDSDQERAENLALAQSRTDQVDAACDAAVSTPYTGCTATLAVLLNRADALDPANARALADPATDGIYVLGGDQGIAMDVLADSPAEAAITAALHRGVALGGTSAGAAVESRSMINGYTGSLDFPDGLRRGSTLVWWGDDADRERGLDAGSTAAIYDQHFYQRGRFGRTLSTIATADERGGGASPVGVGVDYATGVRSTGDRTLSGVFGQSSVALVDLDTLGATHTWVGTTPTLSARGVLTHLMTEHTAYDLSSRVLSRSGTALPTPRRAPWTPPASPATGRLVLGGGILGTPVLDDAVRSAIAANPSRSARAVVLSADRGQSNLASSYAQAVKKAGWTGTVRTVSHGSKGWRSLDLRCVTLVLLVAADAADLSVPMGDPAFRAAVTTAVRRAPVVVTDGPLTAVVGNRWSDKASPTAETVEDEGIAAFRADDAHWQAGLGLIDATLVPDLTAGARWGRLYAGVAAERTDLAIGVATGSALVMSRRATRVAGASAVVTDGRAGTYWTSRNGALGASGVVLDVFGAGEALRP